MNTFSVNRSALTTSAAAIVVLFASCVVALAAGRETSPTASKASAANPDIVELGTAEVGSTAKLPAAAGGNVDINVRVTLRTSQSVLKTLNDGISSGRFQPPFENNKEFMTQLLNSRPGSFEIEFLWLNKESRFYFFFEQQLQKLKTHPSIPDGLKKRTNELSQQAKKFLYQSIRPNDYEGAKIVFEQAQQGGNIVFFNSNKRGNKEVGRVKFNAEEEPILETMRRMLTEQQPPQKGVTVTERGNLDDIFKTAQKKGLLAKEK